MIHATNLKELPDIEHAFGCREDGAWLPASGHAWVKQIHSGIVIRARAEGLQGEADAIITTNPELWVSIRTADCLPILLADPAARVVAAVHAGWRGTVEQIAAQAVAGMLATVDANVIVFSEFTRAHQSALQASPLADDYPHRIERSGRGATGIAVWSRYPMRIGDVLETFNDSLDVTVAGPDGGVRIAAMHMPTPIIDFDAWRTDLATAAQIGRTTDEPTLLIGDLNSSYWHPDFRRLLDAGFVDANAAAGSGFSTSWPTDWWIPPFVRLDHALTTGGLVSTDVYDLDVPGSDHRGLVVTVAPTR